LTYKIYNKNNTCILYNNELLDRPEAPFDTGCPSRVNTADTERGCALFFEYQGADLVLKHYYRGGLIGRLVRDTYARLPGSSPRMLAEFRLLTELHKQKLPVPVPVAARCQHGGALSYRGDLISKRIPGAKTLYQHLRLEPLSVSQWQRIGKTLSRFHAANVYHADLNASNILLDTEYRPWLIDFDKSAIRADGSWKFANLKRLRRSLDKLQRRTPEMHFCERDWQALLDGYDAPPIVNRQPMYAKLGLIVLTLLA
jgi:tRNA A-37 threonylcarbamoyl transferase component Bud32